MADTVPNMIRENYPYYSKKKIFKFKNCKIVKIETEEDLEKDESMNRRFRLSHQRRRLIYLYINLSKLIKLRF